MANDKKLMRACMCLFIIMIELCERQQRKSQIAKQDPKRCNQLRRVFELISACPMADADNICN